ncbi:MAG: glycoside hydrolase family 38 N-terminal domain-containing protein [Planctomycetota bacterium]|jgi:hypothetical protein
MLKFRSPLVVLSLLVCFSTAHAAETGSPVKLNEVIVVFKTHFDLGYTELAREVVDRYRTSMIDNALAVCDAGGRLPREHRFVWTIPGWPMGQMLWSGQTARRRARIEQAIRDGRLVWHALPGTTHTESLELEDLVRAVGFSSRLSRQFGQPLARDAKMTDVPSHTWVLPTLLRHAGVEFLHVGCNSGSASPELPMLFWWEGPDGSRLLTFYAASGYGSQLKPPEGWPYNTWLALIHSGDNQGPPQPEAVEKLLAGARHDLPGVKVRMGRLADFADAVLREPAEIPVVRADMPDTWIYGILSMPIESTIARNVRPAIVGLEATNTVLIRQGVGVPPVENVVAAAYEQSFLYGEHTWGASSRYYSPRIYGKAWQEALAAGKYAYAEESWREHGAYARKLQELVMPALEANMQALARAVNVDGPRLVVFNPLPWERSDVVSVDATSTTPVAWKDAVTAEQVPTALDGGKLRLLAANVPPLGYRTYVPTLSAGEKDAASFDTRQATMENEFFVLHLDRLRGGIASLAEKSSGRELIDKKSKYLLGQYLYERFNDDIHRAYVDSYRKHKQRWTETFGKPGMSTAAETPYLAASPRDFRLEMHENGVALRAAMTAAADQSVPHDVSITVTLPRNLPFVDLEWTVRDKKPEPWAEAGWLCLPLAVAEPVFRLGRVGSIIDPAKDICPGANHEFFCLSTGLTVTDRKDQGVGLCPIDSPLVSLGTPGLFRYTRRFAPRQGTVFVNLYNNVWGTNFQQWIGGSWSSRVRIWATDCKSAEAGLISPGWEARCPCHAALASGAAGKLAPSDAIIKLSRKGVLVTALGPNPDGDGLLLRLWEQAGADGSCQVRLADWLRVSQAYPCNLRGQPAGPPIAIANGTFEVVLRRFAPATMAHPKKSATQHRKNRLRMRLRSLDMRRSLFLVSAFNSDLVFAWCVLSS